MKRLRVGIVDLVSKGPTTALYPRIMNANFASVMSQVVAIWCEEAGHHVTLVCYTGSEHLLRELPRDLDVVFISAFSEAAFASYALSHFLRSRGVVTALGGPHARCYPEDAQKYFDFVLGFTDRSIIQDVLRDHSAHRPVGLFLSARHQPTSLPGVRERWRYIESNLRKAPLIKIVPILGSLGCPYSCSFCIDSSVPFQTFDFDELRRDLAFLLQKLRKPVVGWHDPNFGVRFDECLDAIEDVVPPSRIDFIAESNLSLLSEARVARLRRNGFKALLPGIESWFSLGEKATTGQARGLEKVRLVSEHVNMILRYVP